MKSVNRMSTNMYKKYNGVSLRKEDLMCAVVIVRLLLIRCQDTASEE
jgi:hypothetical protein